MRISDWSSDVCSSDLGSGDRRQRIDLDAGLLAFDPQGAHETDQAHFRGSVARLAEIAEQSGSRGRQQDSTAPPAFFHRVEGRLRDEKAAAPQMDVNHRTGFVEIELRVAAIAQDARVRDQGIEPAPLDRKSTRLNSSH